MSSRLSRSTPNFRARRPIRRESPPGPQLLSPSTSQGFDEYTLEALIELSPRRGALLLDLSDSRVAEAHSRSPAAERARTAAYESAYLAMVTLSGWGLFLVLVPGIGTPTTHVAGYNERGREGRVSSPIEKVDEERRCVVTSTGRVYRLYGRPGLGSEASYVWARWLSIWNVDVKEDLSQATLDGFEAVSGAGRGN